MSKEQQVATSVVGLSLASSAALHTCTSFTALPTVSYAYTPVYLYTVIITDSNCVVYTRVSVSCKWSRWSESWPLSSLSGIAPQEMCDDTRLDTYGLGHLLYELSILRYTFGHLPFPSPSPLQTFLCSVALVSEIKSTAANRDCSFGTSFS